LVKAGLLGKYLMRLRSELVEGAQALSLSRKMKIHIILGIFGRFYAELGPDIMALVIPN